MPTALTRRLWIAAAVALFAHTASAEVQIYGDADKAVKDLKLKVGLEFRARWDYTQPEQNTTTYAEYVYYRTKPSLRLQLPGGDDNLFFRLANRVHENTHLANDAAYPGNFYEFPDEWVVDNLYYETWLAGSKDANGLALKIGRQDFNFLNGMAICDSTPGDGSRTIGYFDGVSAVLKQAPDTFTAVAFYDNATDWLPAINKQHNQDMTYAPTAEWRVVRPGDIQLYGGNWNHVYILDGKKELLGHDLYAFYINNEWRYPHTHAIGNKAKTTFYDVEPGSTDDVGLFGGRLYGTPHPLVDLSSEAAVQAGRLAGCSRANVDAGAYEEDVTLLAYMLDLRMTLKSPEGIWGRPTLLTEYTLYSGDDGDKGRYSGWMNYYNQYPIWNDELFGYLHKGFYFTNMQQLRFDLSATPYDRSPDKPKPADKDAYFKAGALCNLIWPVTNYGGEGGGYKGTQIGFYGDYKPVKWWRLTATFSWFFPGDYYRTRDQATIDATPWRSGETSAWASLATYIYF